MKAAWVKAERDSEVREAARAWRRSGAIDEATLAAIEARYPGPWPSSSALWSTLAFVFVTIAVLGVFVFLGSGFRSVGPVSFLLAAGLPLVTERLRASPSAAAAASGGAAAYWAVACLTVGIADAFHFGEGAATPALLAGALAFGAGAWRWGYPAFAAFSASYGFLLFARFPGGRLVWLLAGCLLSAACLPLLDRPGIAPSHRRCAGAALATALAAVYAAVNLYSLDHRLIEALVDWRPRTALLPPALRTASALATAVFPAALLAWGILSRRRLLLDLGAVSAAFSLVTLRTYVHLAPLWTLLSAAGAALIGLALGLHRWLARSPDRQRGGFTGDALFEDQDRQNTVAVAAAALTLGPEPKGSAPAAEPGAFRGGGGVSGGAGSSGSF
jgi:hypothetical protein